MAGGRPTRVAYLVSRFPKVTETFVLDEMLAVERCGIEIELCPLRRERTELMHAEARRFVERAHYAPLLSPRFVGSHFAQVRRKPATYVRTWQTLVRSNWGSRRYLAGALAFFPLAVDLAQRLESMGVDHVHAHFASHPAAVAWVVRQLTGIPYSFTAHGSDLHRDRHMLREKVRDAAFVVAISDYNRRVIRDTCGDAIDEKIAVIHCGVDVDSFRPRDADSAHERGQGPFNVVCTGTLHEVKGQSYLIEACRLLAERGLDVVCHLVGDGPDRQALDRQAEASRISDRVRFHGALTRDRVAELLAASDAAAQPSVPTRSGRREGIPVALMEAMGSGLPVVASRLSGIPELAEDLESGLLIPPGDSLALADRLEQLYHDPLLRRRLGRAGRDKVRRDFDLGTNAARLAERFSSAGLQEIEP